jgi:hypothetical protein
VIMGRLIPAGTGMELYHNIRLTEELVPEEPVEPEPDLEADLLSSSLSLDLLKAKKVDMG